MFWNWWHGVGLVRLDMLSSGKNGGGIPDNGTNTNEGTWTTKKQVR